MSGSANKVILIGNVGKDPEIRSGQDGRKIATLSVATSEKWTDKNSRERKEKTEWHKVVIFAEGLVKIVEEYIKKGMKVYIEGSLQTRKWTDPQGIDRYSTEVVIQGFNGTITMLDSRGSDNFSSPNSQSYSDNNNAYEKYENTDLLDDEIPF